MTTCGNIEEEIATMTTAEQGQKPWVDALREDLGDAVSSEPQELRAHGNDEGYRYENRPPECVVYARNKEDVVSVLRVAREHTVPVTARGAASSLEGNALPVRGGISLDLTRMNRVISVDPESMTVAVEAGVRRKELNRRLREHRLFLSVDPGADATVGGWPAPTPADRMPSSTEASGIRLWVWRSSSLTAAFSGWVARPASRAVATHSASFSSARRAPWVSSRNSP